MGWLGRSDEDYRNEIDEHIELETQANIERGMSPAEARRAARIAFGSVAGVRQHLHEGRSAYWLSALGQDVRYGLRTMLKNRLLSCVVVLTMSVGIGCTTAVFSLLNAMVFTPPVSHDPDSFVQFVRATDVKPFKLADVPRYEALRDQSRSLRELAAWSSSAASAPLGGAGAAPVTALLASCNVFQVISGAPALAGRLLQPSDCAARSPVAVLSERIWRRRFDGDPGIVGRSMAYGNHAVTIVGVVSVLDSRMAMPPAALWLPYTLQPQMEDLFMTGGSCSPPELPGCKAYLEAESAWLSLAGRVAPGYSRAAAAAELKVFMSRESLVDPGAAGLTLTDGSLWSLAPVEVAWALALVLALPTMIALIVCANVAALLLSRAVKRQQEMAIRLAIGGGRLKLVRMLFVEQLLLAGVAAVLSLWLVRTLPAIILAQFPGLDDGVTLSTTPDWRALAYLGVVTMLTAICAGTAPALESLNVQLGQSLQGRRVLSGSRQISRTQSLLICAQVALSMVPLVGTAAFFRAERGFVNPAFETRQVVVASLDPDQRRGSALQWPTERVETLPAVRSTAVAAEVPPFTERTVTVEAQSLRREFPSVAVSPTYFRTLGIALVSGRRFRDDDILRGDSQKAAIVSTEFARRVFVGENAVGKVFDVPAEHKRFEIVGVAADTGTGPQSSFFANDRSLIYQLAERVSDRSTEHYLLVRFDGDVRQFGPVLQSALISALGVFVSVDTIQSALDDHLAPLSAIRTLVTATGAIGLTLALIGVFGILAFTAVQRRKEAAIRAAVGASRADIFGGMIRPALRPTGLGVAVGAALSFGMLRIFESRMALRWGSPSVDVVAYLAGGLLLLCAAFAAMTPPAYRAAMSDPARALRED